MLERSGAKLRTFALHILIPNLRCSCEFSGVSECSEPIQSLLEIFLHAFWWWPPTVRRQRPWPGNSAPAFASPSSSSSSAQQAALDPSTRSRMISTGPHLRWGIFLGKADPRVGYRDREQ
ncbi:L-lactate dehydrogenase [cytochrome] [Striga asiatica]|uniref:L-lactate dehydrogenase [cytochrome] n=1 Tax=Striga asiatica TaxID=4170 RepID=A0A5A7PT72_STRAF|nr:L-lactate dehydrogenase [cytochrome] [Striga asiatica]